MAGFSAVGTCSGSNPICAKSVLRERKDRLVALQLIALGGGGEDDPLLGGADTQEQVADARKGARPTDIVSHEESLADGLDLLSLSLDDLLRQEDRHELVATLANLPAHLIMRHLAIEMAQRLGSGGCVQVHGVDKCPVHVED